MFCTKCGNKLEEGAKFCASCGTQIEAAPAPPAEPVCANCGAKLEPGIKFCSACGAPTGAAQGAHPPAYQAPQYQQAAYQQGYAPPPAAPGKNPLHYFACGFKKCVVLKGRARRAELWWFTLFVAIINIVLMGIDYVLEVKLGIEGWWLSRWWGYGTLVPSSTLCVRRMHDIGKNGWFALIPIYNIVLFCTAGNAGPNQYGEDPKQESAGQR